MDDIKIDLPICDQFHEAHEPAWAHRICAISSLWMLLKLHNPEFKTPVMDLVNACNDNGGYMENIGWKHSAIVQLASTHGLKLQFAQRFFYSLEEKEKGLQIINHNLRQGQPVIISIFLNLDPARGSHMVVVHGFQQFGSANIGYYIQDPDKRFRGHNYFLTKNEFIDGWRGGLISKVI